MLCLVPFVAFVGSYKSLPTTRGNCSVNINGYNFSLSDLVGTRPVDIYYDRKNFWNYYVSLCDSLTPEEIGAESTLDLTGVLVARCHSLNTDRCLALLNEEAFDWRLYDPSSPEAGVVYFGKGDPYFDPESPYEIPYTFDIEVAVLCDPSATGSGEVATFNYEISGMTITLKMELRSAAGCSKSPGPPPSPSPDGWFPKCQFTRRNGGIENLGIKADLSQLNNGPYGNQISVTVAGEEKWLFLQPCERTTCPMGFQCPDDEWSSAWLCGKTDKRCDSYGVVDTQTTTMDLLDPSDEMSGLAVRIAGKDGLWNTTLNLNCHGFWPDGHINFLNEVTSTSSGIVVNATVRDVCPSWIPAPVPPGDKCTLWELSTKGENVHIDLSDLNNGSSGWAQPITIEGSPSYSTLMYQPCGAMECPADTYCDGDEDATIWLCRSAPSRECVGYGLYDKDVQMSLKNPDAAAEGVLVVYRGARGRSAQVTFTCNEEMQSGHIQIASSGSISDNTFRITAQALGACPTSGPTPPPTPSPSPTPGPTAKPTPTGQPSASPTPGPEPVPTPSESLPIGAIAMLAVLVFFILYVFVGTFVTFARAGRPSFPNAGFWGEVDKSLRYLLCCCKPRLFTEATTEGPRQVFMESLTQH